VSTGAFSASSAWLAEQPFASPLSNDTNCARRGI
jgi:hypothetical protein